MFRNKIYSLINIAGLAVGISTCALITLYVMDETSYDKHHNDGERIYRIAAETKARNGYQPLPRLQPA